MHFNTRPPPFFSVIIPTYNRLPYLLEALESVAKQLFTDYEVIVVDDGSQDGTEIAVSEMLKNRNAEPVPAGAGGEDCCMQPEGQDERGRTSQKPKLKYIRQENAGPGAARNLGASVARGEYLAFLDSDDLWLPWSLKCYSEAIVSNNHPVLLCGKIQESLEEVSPSVEPVIKSSSKHYPNFISSFPDECFVGAGKMVVKKKDFLAIGGFCNLPINLEDHDCVLRLGDRMGFVDIVSPSTLIRRRHQGNLSDIPSKTIAGAFHLLEQEKNNKYPGGVSRKVARQVIISRHLRPVAVAALQNGRLDAAWEICKATLGWHLALGKWKFLLGMPLAIIAKKIAKRK